MITINKLQKNFGEKKAVDIESYMIDQGDMLGLVGNNGAGKTTLFRLILDLLKADAGNVTINDVDVSKSEEWKKFTGAFIDDGFLIDYLTPEEYFYFIGKMYGLKKDRYYLGNAPLSAVAHSGRTVQLPRSEFTIRHQTFTEKIQRRAQCYGYYFQP